MPAAAGLSAVEMNILTELWIGMPLLSYTATRGWPPLPAGWRRGAIPGRRQRIRAGRGGRIIVARG